MIGIVDYGMGNLLSVFNALDMIGAEAMIVKAPARLSECDRIILPGVGAFKDCIGHLHQHGFVTALNEEVLGKGKPIFGICLGMQVMATRGFEFGEHEGLGWFEADVVSLRTLDPHIRIPQIGWNNLSFRAGVPLFNGLRQGTDTYFVHSFFMKCASGEDVVCTTEYGGQVTAAVMKKNIFATQFHPEKSQDHGLRILQNFMNWNP